MKTLEQKIYDGDRAKEVLENEAFEQAFNDTEKELTCAWQQSPQRDVAGREHLFLALTMLNKVRESLTTTLETGKLSLLELQHKKKLAERAKGFLGMGS